MSILAPIDTTPSTTETNATFDEIVAEIEIPHGTYSGYGTHKCRCDECRAANNAHRAAERDRHRSRDAEKLAADLARLRPHGLKECGRCHRQLPLSNYGPNITRGDGYNETCLACVVARRSHWKAITLNYPKLPGTDKTACFYGCGREAKTIDHFEPICRGGKDLPGNRVPACRPCNERKGRKSPEVFMQEEGISFRRPLALRH